jgi:UDP-N-acetylmuramate: L-alanyl-gamma-D-glutamyl-meso-diaminopimelate ligase
MPQATLPEVLREYVFGEATRIVVAGTHGKTTTTGIVTALFDAGGKEPGFMIGGVPQNKERGFAVGKGDYAIFEGDEYDTSYFNKMPKFLQYGAHTGIVTSLELDHLDIYSDLKDYTQAFNFFAQEIPEDGFLFINGDDAALQHLKAEAAHCTVRTYGFDDRNDIYAKHTRTTEEGVQRFTVVVDGKELGEVETPLPGLYNVANCLAAIGVAHAHGIAFDAIKKGLKGFGGMKRRQEIVAEIDGITVIDDFAHHPTSVKATLGGIKTKYFGRRIVALFEPRSNSSRKKIFEKEYMESFGSADYVCLKTPPLRHNDSPDDFIDPQAVVDAIKKANPDTEAYAFADIETLLDETVPKLKEGDVVMVMSNGTFDGLKEKLVERLKEK